jgi:protein-L-isoaspartate(D-aspartate) O-methyltransferase
MNFAQARANMVESQIRPNGITDSRIIEAMGAVAREDFVPDALRAVAYMDEDIAIAPGRALMEPMAFARLAQLAAIAPHDRILHVGCGSGYGSAILSRLGKEVVALESDEGLAASASAVPGANVHRADLSGGRAADGPYDVIVVEGRIPEVPASLLQQLKDGGRLVAVVGDNAVSQAVLHTSSAGSFSSRTAFDASVAPLPGFAARKKAGFVF